MVETRTSGETRSCGRDKDQWRRHMVLWWRQGPVGETRSCGRDKDQWGRHGLVVETRTSGGDKVLWQKQGPVGKTWSCG